MCSNLGLPPNRLILRYTGGCSASCWSNRRAVWTKANIQSGEKVLIAKGSAVFATLRHRISILRHSSNKKLVVIELSATGGVLYTDEDWTKQLQRLNPRGFDVVIDSAGEKALVP